MLSGNNGSSTATPLIVSQNRKLLSLNLDSNESNVLVLTIVHGKFSYVGR